MKTNIKISTRNLNFHYGKHQALFDNNLDIHANKITAVIGPSGCGKSTHLRIYNRIFELYRNQTVRITRAAIETKLIRFKDDRFYKKLCRKMRETHF